MTTGRGIASRYNRRIRIERQVPGEEADSAGSDPWEKVCEVSASVVDTPPSRPRERLADGINVSERPSQVRIRFRTDITSGMRFALLHREGGEWVVDRLTEVVAGPAEIGFREELEFMVQAYSSAGGGQ